MPRDMPDSRKHTHKTEDSHIAWHFPSGCRCTCNNSSSLFGERLAWADMPTITQHHAGALCDCDRLEA